MKKKPKSLIFWILFAIIIIAGIIFLVLENRKPGEFDDFARCLEDKGTIFYGAFWCNHCQNQKKLFGKSAKLLPYIECSTPDGKGQLSVCTDVGVSSYPTWEFSDGSRELGEVSLEKLAEKTGCELFHNKI